VLLVWENIQGTITLSFKAKPIAERMKTAKL
jgi:hypothetical protein